MKTFEEFILEQAPIISTNGKTNLKQDLNLYVGYYEIYKTEGFTKFVKVTGYDKSQPNLVKQFSKYVSTFAPQNGKPRLDNSVNIELGRIERREVYKDKKRAANTILFNNYYDIYTSVGFDEFVKITGFSKPKASLTMSFSYYVEGYKKVV